MTEYPDVEEQLMASEKAVFLEGADAPDDADFDSIETTTAFRDFVRSSAIASTRGRWSRSGWQPNFSNGPSTSGCLAAIPEPAPW
jgi:hypothetical protein